MRKYILLACICGLTSYSVAFVDFPQNGDKETIGMNIEKQDVNVSPSNNSVKVDKDAIKGLEIAFGSTPAVTFDMNSPMVEIREVSLMPGKISNETEEYEFYPTGKIKFYKHIYPIKDVKQTPADKFMSFIITALPSWFVAIVLLATLIFFAYKKFIKKGDK